MLTNKHNTIAKDLRLDLANAKQVGNTFVAMSGAKAYVLGRGQAYEIAPGMILNLPSISHDEISSVSGASQFGVPTQENEGTYMLSKSNVREVDSFKARAIDPETVYVVDNADVEEAAHKFAHAWSSVLDTQDLITSCSAFKAAEWTFEGKEATFEEASDEYDVTLEKGDKFTLQYINRDNYVLKIKGVREKFYITGNKRIINLLARSKTKNQMQAVASNDKLEFKYEGTVNRNLMRPLRIAKGTKIYSSFGKLFLEYNLQLPLTDVISQSDQKTILQSCVDESGPNIVNGNVGAGAVNAQAVQVAQEDRKTVWGVAVPVNPNQLHRSRIFFAPDADSAKQLALDFLSNVRTAVPFLMFETNGNNDLYRESKTGRVLIKHTELVRKQFRATEMRIEAPLEAFVNMHPREDTPDLTIPAISSKTNEVAMQIRQLIDLGYFINGIRLSIQQPRDGIQFEAQHFDDSRYNALVGAARRIIVWLKRQGVPVDGNTVTLARGESRVVMEFKFHKPRDLKSVELLQTDPPTLDAPIYENTKRAEPTVEITHANIHTGQVTCRMQRSATLYSAPYLESYSFIKRRKF